MIELAKMGELFKQIRISKRLTLKDVAGDYLSISFLSKFERGESDISLSRFFQLLEQLDVSIEEFYGVLAKERATETEQLLAKISSAYYEDNRQVLQGYLTQEMTNYKQTSQKKHYYNAIMIRSFLAALQGGQVEAVDVKEMTDYLFGIEHWGKRELVIFGNSMSAISTPVLDVLVRELVQKTAFFGRSEENKKVSIALLINAVSVFLDRDDLALAKSYLALLASWSMDERYLYERLEYQMVLGAYEMKSGQLVEGQSRIERALTCLDALGAKQLYSARKSSYENLLGQILGKAL